MLLYLCVAKGLGDATAVGSKEVVRHVGVEVEIVVIADKVPLLVEEIQTKISCRSVGSISMNFELIFQLCLCRVLELLVVVVDDADAVRLAVGDVARKVGPHPRP